MEDSAVEEPAGLDEGLSEEPVGVEGTDVVEFAELPDAETGEGEAAGSAKPENA
jgi:hypothetical protein